MDLLGPNYQNVNTAAEGTGSRNYNFSIILWRCCRTFINNCRVTEFWNGTSWTELSDLSTARQRGGGGGTLASAIMAGGRPPGSSPTSSNRGVVSTCNV